MFGLDWSQVKGFVWLAFGNAIAVMPYMIVPFASTSFVARLDTKYLDASTLANMFINCTGFTICLGIGYAQAVFASQCYGARLYSSVGLYFQRGLALISATLIPFSVIWYYADVILSWVGLSEHALLTAEYCRIMILGMWPLLAFGCLRGFLLAQSVSWPVSATVLIVIPLHILVAWLFVVPFGLGFHGGAWSTVFSNWLLLVVACLLIWVRDRYYVAPQQAHQYTLISTREASDLEADNRQQNRSEYHENEHHGNGQGSTSNPPHTPTLADLLPPLSRECFSGWYELLLMGIPIGLTFLLSYGAFELTLMAASSQGTLSLSVHSILYHTINIWYQLNVGLSVAGTSQVGNSLGSNNPQQARNYALFSLFAATCHGVVTGGVFTLVLQRVWGQIFTSDEAVLSLLAEVMPVVWVYGLWDAVLCAGNGVLLGCGRSTLTLILTIISFGGVGIPSAFLFMPLIHPGLKGLWVAMTCAVFACAFMNCVAIWRTNWEEQALSAKGNSSESKRED